MLQALIDVTLELAPWLLLGTVIAALMHGLLPAGFVRRHLGGREGERGGLGAVTKAVAVGVPLPLCSCGVIPAGLGLRKDGASRGASVGFLISTPQTGVDSVLVSASMLGWPFALFKVLTAGVLGVFGGWLTDATASPADRAADGADASSPTGEDGAPSDRARPGLHDMVAHGVDVLRSIWKWLVFGVVTSALITTYVPHDTFAGLSGAGELLMFLGVLLVSLPLYVCATASVPIAAALVGAGMPLGGALVFLMAGPATNVATIGSVHRALGTRALATYLGVIVVGSIAAALGFEALVTHAPDWAAFGAGAQHAAHAGHGAAGEHAGHAHDGPAYVGSALVLAGLLVFFVYEELRALLGAGFAATKQPASGAQLTHVHMAVDGMTCGGCAKKLQRALLAGEGVQHADVQHEPGHIDVDVVAADAAAAREMLAAIVRATGYTPKPASAGRA